MKRFRAILGVSAAALASTVAVEILSAQAPGQPGKPPLAAGAPLVTEPPRALRSMPGTVDDVPVGGGGSYLPPIFNLPGSQQQHLDAINAMVNRAISLGDVAPNYQRIADTLDKGFPLFAPDSLDQEARRKIVEQNIRLVGIDPPKGIADVPPVPNPVQNGQPIPNGQNGNDGFKQTVDEINKLFRTQAELIRSIDVGSVRRIVPGDPTVGVADGGVVVIGGRTGFQLGLISPTVYEHIKVPRDQGLLLKEVFPNTPAAAAGYKKNDLLLELNGRKVPSNLPDFMEKVMRTIKNDVPFTGVVLRGGEPVEVGPMKITDRRVIPALPNERAPDLSSIIQVVPGINSDQQKTNRVPEVRMIRTVVNGITTTEIVPVTPPVVPVPVNPKR